MNQEIGTCAFCRADKSVMRKTLYAKNKPMVGDGFTFIYYCDECGIKEEQRAKKHLQILISLAKAVGAWYNAPNEKVEESYHRKIRELYEEWCEYRHDYTTSNPFEDGLQHFIDDLK